MGEPLAQVIEVAGKLGPLGGVVILLVLAMRLLLQAEARHRSEVERITSSHKTEMERITKAHNEELEEVREELGLLRGRVDSLQQSYDEERQKRFAAESVAHALRIRMGVGGLDNGQADANNA